jgi:hypothetical protein
MIAARRFAQTGKKILHMMFQLRVMTMRNECCEMHHRLVHLAGCNLPASFAMVGHHTAPQKI